MNGVNGSVAVLTTTTTTTSEKTVSTVAADPDKANNNDNNNISNNNHGMDSSTSQIVTELNSEDRFIEHEEYSTGKVKVKSYTYPQTDVQTVVDFFSAFDVRIYRY